MKPCRHQCPNTRSQNQDDRRLCCKFSRSCPISMATLILWLVLLLPSRFTLAQSLLDCYSTLAELRTAMETEFLAVVMQNETIRPAPYIYTLCPNTTFKVLNKDVDIILPILDRTEIRCGPDGSSLDNCVIDEDGLGPDEPEVLLIPTEIPGMIRNSTFFQGLTFTNSKGWSVAAYDASPAQVMFLDCHWMNNSGNSIIHIQPRDLPPLVQIGIEGMRVSLEDCVFENEQFSLGSGEAYNASTVALKAPVVVVGSSLLMSNVTIRDSTVNYAVFSKFGRVHIEHSRFEGIAALDTVLVMFGFGVLVNNYFGENRNLISTVEAVDSGINVSLCEFEGNEGLSDVLALDDGRDGNRSTLAFVQNSCFKRGQYQMGPVFVAGKETSHQVVNNYVHETVDGANCPTSTFLEPDNIVCLDPDDGLLLQEVDCSGTCLQGGFDADGCPRSEREHFKLVPRNTTLGGGVDSASSQESLLSQLFEWKEIRDVRLPKALSDMTATPVGADSILISGGCDDALGNHLIERIGVYACASISRSFYRFNLTTQSFTSLPDMPRARYRHSATLVSGANQLWLLGGRTAPEDTIVDDVDVYDIATDTWMTLPAKLPQQYLVSDHGATTVPSSKGKNRGLIFVVGGYTATYEAQSRCFAIDTRRTLRGGRKTDLRIREMRSLVFARGDVQVLAPSRSELYVMGGFSHVNDFCAPLSTVERYSMQENEWTITTSLVDGRGCYGSAVVNLGTPSFQHELLLVLGGESRPTDFCSPAMQRDEDTSSPQNQYVAVQTVEILNLAAAKKEDRAGKAAGSTGLLDWQRVLDDMPTARYRFAATAMAATDMGEKKNNNSNGIILWVLGGQQAYDDACQCFATSDSILTLSITSTCSDEADFAFGKEGQTCAWLATRKKNRQKKLCLRSIRKRPISEACCMTCLAAAI